MSSRAPIPTDSPSRALILLMAGLAVVYWTSSDVSGQASKTKKQVERSAPTNSASTPQPLPKGVIEMLDGIQAAVRTGRIEDLKPAIAWNELPPSIDASKVDDPISFWRKQSADGEGREILAILAAIIDAGYAVLPLGRDVENNRLYVWPRFAEMALDTLSPEDEVQLYRLVSPAQVKAMREKRKWTWYRLAIGADGTWHSFQKH